MQRQIRGIVDRLARQYPHGDDRCAAAVELLEDRPWTETSRDEPIVRAIDRAVRDVRGSTPVYNGVPGATDGAPEFRSTVAAMWEVLAANGFDWIWLLSVWQTGAAGRDVSRANSEWRREFHETLDDLCDDDIPGSGFAINPFSSIRIRLPARCSTA